MQEVSTDRGKFRICDSPKELTIDRYTEFQKYLLQDSGIGSTIEDVYRHSEKLDAFLSSGKIAEAIAERSNQHYNFYMMLNRISLTHLAFALFVESIDGALCTDYSDSGLQTISLRLGQVGLQRGQLEAILEDVKKKLIPN